MDSLDIFVFDYLLAPLQHGMEPCEQNSLRGLREGFLRLLFALSLFQPVLTIARIGQQHAFADTMLADDNLLDLETAHYMPDNQCTSQQHFCARQRLSIKTGYILRR